MLKKLCLLSLVLACMAQTGKLLSGIEPLYVHDMANADRSIQYA